MDFPDQCYRRDLIECDKNEEFVYINQSGCFCKRRADDQRSKGDSHANTTISYSISKKIITIKCWQCCSNLGIDVDPYFVKSVYQKKLSKCIKLLKQ